MKPVFAPQQFKKDAAFERSPRKSYYDGDTVNKLNYLEKKGRFRDNIKSRGKVTISFAKANELPFSKYTPGFEMINNALVSDDSGDSKDEKTDLYLKEKALENENALAKVLTERRMAILDGEYQDWKAYEINKDGVRIRWTGEMSFYGPYVLFSIVLQFRPDVLVDLLFKKAELHKTPVGRFLIVQFYEKLLNIRYVNKYFELIEKIKNVNGNDLDENKDFQALEASLVPGVATFIPMANATLAIARSVFVEKDMPASHIFLKQAQSTLLTPTVNYFFATIVIDSFGGTFGVLTCQIAATMIAELFTSSVISLSKTYLFVDYEASEKTIQEANERKILEKKKQEVRDLRRRYIELGIVGKDLDQRIRLDQDYKSNLIPSLKKFQEDLLKSWNNKGKAVPIFGSTGFNALLLLWGSSTTMATLTFLSSTDFTQFELSTGKNINVRFMFDFLTKMLKEFKFFGGLITAEMLALPVIQRLRGDFIRIFSELVANIIKDIKGLTSRLKEKVIRLDGEYGYIYNLTQQSRFANYFFLAMSKILNVLDKITDPFLIKVLSTNILNTYAPQAHNITKVMFLWSIEDTLALFRRMNLHFMKFGVSHLTSAEGHLDFTQDLIDNLTTGSTSNPVPTFYKKKEGVPEMLKPGTILRKVLDSLWITVPDAFQGYDPQYMFLGLPSDLESNKLFMDIPLKYKIPESDLMQNVTDEQKKALVEMWSELSIFQKLPGIFAKMIEDAKKQSLTGEIFEAKKNDPVIKEILKRFKFTDQQIAKYFTKEMFDEFAKEYPSFLERAVSSLNLRLNSLKKEGETEVKITLEELENGKPDRETLKLFANILGQTYSEHIRESIFKNAPLFNTFNQSFTHNYMFKEEDDNIASHNLSFVKGGIPKPEGYDQYDFDVFMKDIVEKQFFIKRKIKVMQRGREGEDGKFIEDEKEELVERTLEIETPERDKEKIKRSFKMMNDMGYIFFYKKGDGKNPDGKSAPVFTPTTVSRDFEDFITNMVKEHYKSVNKGKTLPDGWNVKFIQEGNMMDKSLHLYSGELNTVDIEGTTHFFYRFAEHYGLGDYIIRKELYESKEIAQLESFQKEGKMTLSEIAKLESLRMARNRNIRNKSQIEDNYSNKMLTILNSLEQHQIRNTESLRFYDLFMNMAGPDQEDAELFHKLMSSLGPNGATPNALLEFFGAFSIYYNYYTISGDFRNPDRIKNRPDIKTPSQWSLDPGDAIRYYNSDWDEKQKEQSGITRPLTEKNQKKESIGKILSPDFIKFYNNQRKTTLNTIIMELFGFFNKENESASYQMTSINNHISESKSQTLNYHYEGEVPIVDSINLEKYDQLVNKDGTKLNEIKGSIEYPLTVALKFLYLVMENGKINKERFDLYLGKLEEMRQQAKNNDKEITIQDQADYINKELNLLERDGKKQADAVSQFLAGSKYSKYRKNKVEANLDLGSHYRFQIHYLLDILNIRKRMANGKGLKHGEFFKGTYPFISLLTEDDKFTNLGNFYFRKRTYMGIHYKVLEDIFFKDDPVSMGKWETLKKKIDAAKQAASVKLLRNIPTGVQFSQKEIDDIITSFERIPDSPKKSTTQWLVESVTDKFSHYFKDDKEKIAKAAKEMADYLEGGEILNDMLKDNLLEELDSLILERVTTIESTERVEIDRLKQEQIKEIQDYTTKKIKNEEEGKEIDEILREFVQRIKDKKPTGDIRPPLPTPIPSGTSTPNTGEAPKPSGPSGPGEAERPETATKQDMKVNQSLSEQQLNALKVAEKEQQIQKIAEKITNAQTYAEKTSLTLKLLNLLMETFGGDEGLLWGGDDADLSNFDFKGEQPFDPDVELEAPNPEDFFNPDITDFDNCATLSQNYDLAGANDINLKISDDSQRDKHLECRYKAKFIEGIKYLFSQLLNNARKGTEVGINFLCNTFYGAFVKANPWLAPIDAILKSQGKSPCDLLAKVALERWLIPSITSGIINNSSLLKSFNDPKTDKSAITRIKAYETYFNEEITDKNYESKRKELQYIVSLMLMEQSTTDNDPRISTDISKILYGDGKNSRFNYVPYFKPDSSLITALNKAGKLNVTNVRDVMDLLSKINEIKFDRSKPDDPLFSKTIDGKAFLTIIFGEPYTGPIDEKLPMSYNLWYKVGEAISKLDDYEKTKMPEKKEGNLFFIMNGVQGIYNSIFSVDKNKHIEDEIKKIDEIQRKEEEERELRKRIEEEEKRRANKVLTIDFSGLFKQFTSLLNWYIKDNTIIKKDISQKKPFVMSEESFSSGIVTGDMPVQNGNLTNFPIRVITGEERKGKLDWTTSKITPVFEFGKVTAEVPTENEDRISISNMARNDKYTKVTYATGEKTLLGFDIMKSIDPYTSLNELFDHYKSGDNPLDIFKKTFKKGWVSDSHDLEDLKENGDFPPYFVMLSSDYPTDFGYGGTKVDSKLLSRFYVRQDTKIKIPKDNPIEEINASAVFLKEDLAVFDNIQEKRIVEGDKVIYEPISLIDALLTNKKFRLREVPNQEFSLWLEDSDKPNKTDTPEQQRAKLQTKWIKIQLHRMIFSTLKDSYRPFMSFSNTEIKDEKGNVVDNKLSVSLVRYFQDTQTAQQSLRGVEFEISRVGKNVINVVEDQRKKDREVIDALQKEAEAAAARLANLTNTSVSTNTSFDPFRTTFERNTGTGENQSNVTGEPGGDEDGGNDDEEETAEAAVGALGPLVPDTVNGTDYIVGINNYFPDEITLPQDTCTYPADIMYNLTNTSNINGIPK